MFSLSGDFSNAEVQMRLAESVKQLNERFDVDVVECDEKMMEQNSVVQGGNVIFSARLFGHLQASNYASKQRREDHLDEIGQTNLVHNREDVHEENFPDF